MIGGQVFPLLNAVCGVILVGWLCSSKSDVSDCHLSS